MKQLDIDNFTLSRIPRPGEEDKKKGKEKAEKKSSK